MWIITGAAGFLGNTLVRELLDRGERVRAAIRSTQIPPSLEGLDCEIVQCDVTAPESVLRALAPVAGEETIVVHCAGVVAITDRVSEQVHAVNVGGTINVLHACREQGVDRLVYVSSVHAIPEPADRDETIIERDVAEEFSPVFVTGGYAKTKAEATRLVLEADDLNRVVVHPSGIIGPNDYGDSHLTRLVRDSASGKLTSIVSGGYDFVDVRDVALGIIAAAKRGVSGRTYILSGHFSRVWELVRTVAELAGRKRLPTLLPMWFARFTAPLAEVYYKIRRTKPLYTRYSLYTLEAPGTFSHERATRELGYSPRPFEETLIDTVEWLGLAKSDAAS